MTSLPLIFAIGFDGTATGTPLNSSLTTRLLRVVDSTVSGSGKQCLNIYQTVIPVSGSLLIDLTTGQKNPLGEDITGTDAFATVYDVWVEHDLTSLSTAGITVFGGGANEFRGVLDAGAKATLIPGRWVGFGQDVSITGMTVDGTHKRIDIFNLDAAALHTATVNVFVVGTIP